MRKLARKYHTPNVIIIILKWWIICIKAFVTPSDNNQMLHKSFIIESVFGGSTENCTCK